MHSKVLPFRSRSKVPKESLYLPTAPEGIPAQTLNPGLWLGGEMDTIEFLTAWRVWLEANYAPKTCSMYFGTVVRFLADASVPLPDVTGSMVDQWLSTKTSFRSSARSTYFMALRSCFTWMLRNGYMDTDPTAFIRVPPREEKAPRALTVEQFEAVRAAAYNRDPMRGYALDLLYYSGGRIGETLTLRWEDINWDEEQGTITFTHTKSGKDRVVPMTPGLRHALLGLKSRFGERTCVLPRKSQTVWAWCREAGVTAGVQNVHPHLFRSTAATRMMQAHARPDAVQHMLGHSKLVTTQRYWSIHDEDIREAAQLL